MSKKPKKKDVQVFEDPVKEVGEALTNAMLARSVEDLESLKMKLLLNIKELNEKLEQQKQDHEDIYYYLNKKCDDSYEIIASLEEQILNEQMSREFAERSYEKKIEDLRSKMTSDETKYLAKIADLEDKNLGLKEFGDRKDELEKNLEKLLQTLSEERKQFSRNLNDAENRGIYEKELLKRDFEKQLEIVRSEVQSQIEEKLPETVKQTKQAYDGIRQELRYQCKQADKVLEIHHLTEEKDNTLRIELSLARSAEKEMMKKLSMYQKTVRDLKDCVARNDSEILCLKEQYESTISNLNATIESLCESAQREKSIRVAEERYMDEMWSFLCSCYEASVKPTTFVVAKAQPRPEVKRERILVELVKNVVKRYPAKFPLSMFVERLPSRSGRSRASSPQSSGISLPMIATPANAGTGIDAWDLPNVEYPPRKTPPAVIDSARSSVKRRLSQRTAREVQSVGVQTDDPAESMSVLTDGVRSGSLMQPPTSSPGSLTVGSSLDQSSVASWSNPFSNQNSVPPGAGELDHELSSSVEGNISTESTTAAYLVPMKPLSTKIRVKYIRRKKREGQNRDESPSPAKTVAVTSSPRDEDSGSQFLEAHAIAMPLTARSSSVKAVRSSSPLSSLLPGTTSNTLSTKLVVSKKPVMAMSVKAVDGRTFKSVDDFDDDAQTAPGGDSLVGGKTILQRKILKSTKPRKKSGSGKADTPVDPAGEGIPAGIPQDVDLASVISDMTSIASLV